MEKELEHLGGLLASPGRPFVAVLGGAKVSGKLEVIRNLSKRVDRVLIGGGMAFTFLKARGAAVGRSLVEEDLVPVARETLDAAGGPGAEIELPVDVRVVSSLESGEAGRIVPVGEMPEDGMGVDIGPRTIESFGRSVALARTIFWNGPMGIFERDAFSAGTMELAKAVSAATARGAVSVVGGGDSAAAVARAGVEDGITHVSTGGGASLEFLEGRVLPGVAALTDRPRG
jgi:phosphoglycerate kinase